MVVNLVCFLLLIRSSSSCTSFSCLTRFFNNNINFFAIRVDASVYFRSTFIFCGWISKKFFENVANFCVFFCLDTLISVLEGGGGCRDCSWRICAILCSIFDFPLVWLIRVLLLFHGILIVASLVEIN